MLRSIFFLIPFMLINIVQLSAEVKIEGREDEGMFVHPFLAHMGLPDVADEVSLRTTSFRTRYKKITEGDLAVHVEAGLGHNIGLHIRSDGIRHEEYSEVMLQYGILMDKQMRNGISIFGQLSLPTGNLDKNHYKGLYGISYQLSLKDLARLNGNIHYDPIEEMAEYEDAIVCRMSNTIFPVIEFRGILTNDDATLYMLPAIKFRVKDGLAFGLGFQAALTNVREYETQALFTCEIANY